MKSQVKSLKCVICGCKRMTRSQETIFFLSLLIYLFIFYLHIYFQLPIAMMSGGRFNMPETSSHQQRQWLLSAMLLISRNVSPLLTEISTSLIFTVRASRVRWCSVNFWEGRNAFVLSVQSIFNMLYVFIIIYIFLIMIIHSQENCHRDCTL